MNVELNQCPETLQKSVSDWQDKIPYSKLIAVRKIESTPYKDKSIINTTYKVYFQAGYEFMIISTSETKGINFPLDGEIKTNIFNGGDITTIIEKGDYIKDDLKRYIFNS